jgi:hypothetical protein
VKGRQRAEGRGQMAEEKEREGKERREEKDFTCCQ